MLRCGKSCLGTFFSVLLLGLIIGGWFHFGSFDEAFRKDSEDGVSNRRIYVPKGKNWKIIDGVRWFYINGKDDSGVFFKGWVSEYAFWPTPPNPSPTGKNFLEKLGLPTVQERIAAVKQLQEVGKALRQSLKQ